MTEPSVHRALIDKNPGLNRNALIEKAGLSSGGTMTDLLEELIETDL